MAAIVYQTCKQNDITNAYESNAYWDKQNIYLAPNGNYWNGLIN